MDSFHTYVSQCYICYCYRVFIQRLLNAQKNMRIFYIKCQLVLCPSRLRFLEATHIEDTL